MNEPQMTPEQALSILDQAASQAPLPRQQHVLIQQAVQLLAKLITKPTDNGNA